MGVCMESCGKQWGERIGALLGGITQLQWQLQGRKEGAAPGYSCPQPAEPKEGAPRQWPRCFLHLCHQVESAIWGNFDPHLPSQLNVNIFMFHSCWGYLSSFSTQAPRVTPWRFSLCKGRAAPLSISKQGNQEAGWHLQGAGWWLWGNFYFL